MFSAGYSIATPIPGTTQYPVYTLDDKLVLGRIESVYYSQVDALSDAAFTAKIDTGADTTSIHADDIHVFSQHPSYQHLKDDELMSAVVEALGGTKTRWAEDAFSPFQLYVRFSLQHPHSGELIAIEDELERVAAIKSRSSEHPIFRPVVSMPLTIAGKEVETELNLTNREQFTAPVLIGKTFLRNNAWVMSGYDYLQEQNHATVISNKERVSIQGLEQAVGVSLSNRYTSVHGTNIELDKEARTVSFELESPNKKGQKITLPWLKQITLSGRSYPLVTIPVQLPDGHTQQWQAYVKDRSRSPYQIYLGRETLNKHFVVDTRGHHLLDSNTVSYKARIQDQPAVASPIENVTIDGIAMIAEPSFVVKTPILKVTDFEIIEKGKQDEVVYYLRDKHGKETRQVKPVIKKLRVAGSLRPVVEGKFEVGDHTFTREFALEVLAEDEKQPYFIVGEKMAKNGLLINTRTEHLLESYPLFRAGHIEMAEVEGLEFPVKLDTGADVSSLHAESIKHFEKNGTPMVTFTYRNKDGDSKEFTREVVDSMRIKARQGEKANERPVVEMRVSLGEVTKTIRVNLQDRSNFDYSMILGKNFLRYGALVSSEDKYLLGK